MQWDIFCRVVDNFGDIGVCWRLCADLSARGEQVRLWVDDASALEWMAPGALLGSWSGVQVLDWKLSTDPRLLSSLSAAAIWIEGFGCEIAPEFIASRAHSASDIDQMCTPNPIWLNLEYLSAQAYVERSHGLQSPIGHGPAQGWTKHFYYPGFSDRTGGLLRERDLPQRMARFNAQDWLHAQGIVRKTRERMLSLFCYEPPVLAQLLKQLATDTTPTHLLVTSGRSGAFVRGEIGRLNGLQPSWNMRKSLSISYLPPLSQHDFDHLLWACDLNFVRGEDSLVRALWAGKPLVWQIYPQDDAAHHTKLTAFLDMINAPVSLRRLHAQWNGIEPTRSGTLLVQDEIAAWGESVKSSRDRLLKMDDLTTQIMRFARKNR